MSGFLSILENLFISIFGKILEPVLIAFLQVWWEIFKNIFGVFLGILLYYAYTTLLRFIDILEVIFGIFAGTDLVSYGGKDMSFLEVFFNLDIVSNVFLMFTALGIALTLIFSVYMTVKSISDMSLENKNPISKVLSNCMKSMLMFAIVPFLCLFLLRLSSTLIVGVSNAFDAAINVEANSSQSQNESTNKNTTETNQTITSCTLGTTLFLLTTEDAEKNSGNGPLKAFLNIEKPGNAGTNTTNGGANVFSFSKKPWSDFLPGGTKKYYNLTDAQECFTLLDINYFVGFLTAFFLIIVLSGSIVIFIKRTFEIVLLYLVAPFFAATIPLDDGATFKKWRELFIAKFFTAFGSIFAMKLYLIIIPMVTNSNSIVFSNSSSILNMIIKVAIICGGALTIFKSTSLITSILNEEEANKESETMMMALNKTKEYGQKAVQVGAAVASGGASAATGLAQGGAAFAQSAASGQKFCQSAANGLRAYQNYKNSREKEQE